MHERADAITSARYSEFGSVMASAREAGQAGGLPYAEAFKRLEL